MRAWFRLLWCALRDHPYPTETDREAYQDWLEHREPFPPDVYCSNCGHVFKDRRGGMHS